MIPGASEPPWFVAARRELGIHATPGPAATARILDYLKACPGLPAGMQASDETAWCSAFVNYVMNAAGVRGTRSAAARSWIPWGVDLGLGAERVRVGAVLVLFNPHIAGTNAHGDTHSGYHVTLEAAPSAPLGSGVVTLGGNQDHSVCFKRYATGPWQVVARRWPF